MGIHGGDIYRNNVEIDFSTNTNPLGVPERVKEALHRAVGMCGKYPDIEAGKLKKAVSGLLAVPEEYLLFGNGASELFMAVAHGLRPGKILIPVPSFYGYEYAAKSIGSEIVYYRMKQENGFCIAEDIEDVLTEDVELLFLANPNNPVGNLLTKDAMEGILRRCRDKGIYVVLDECFIEFCADADSMLSEIGASDHLIIVRAFTKIYAVPGVRLGYLVCKNKTILAKIRAQIPEWNVSCFAQEAGCACAGLADFIAKTKKYLKEERQFMEEGLRRKGFLVFPSAANFILFYSEEPLYARLLEKGILIRDCSNFRGLGEGFYRIVVKSREENEILLGSL